MKQLLDSLIADAPSENKGAFSAQIILKNNQGFAGAIRHFVGDVYEITTVGQKQDTRTKTAIELPVKVYVRADDILTVAIEPKTEMPSIITPGGNGIHVPGQA